ncbi:Rhamnan synthesis protein F [Azospirillum sp. RU38E]|nr:Rhamnan synthesis protein F [Azospirillum sp. RU38E]SNT29690.1 Rhamnan synthesis protein F [Azospirillum sp. RU37A]
MRMRRFLSRKLTETVDIIDYVRTHLTSIIRPSYIRRRWSGDVRLDGAKRVVVFNHFDMRGIIHEYVEFYLKELKKQGFSIVFTSNSPRFPEKSVEKLKPLVSVILWRRNVGYDFGAFKDGIAEIPDPQALDMLLITNDSMYGPLQDFAQVINRADPVEADLWGITDCWDGRFHLQSYFLLFHPQAIRSPAFAKFWGNLPYFRRKRWVVRYGEIGLTPFFLSYGVRCKAMFPYRSLISAITPKVEAYLAATSDEADPVRRRYVEMIGKCLRDGVPLNQTHFFWDQLLTDGKCPFIKRDLLQHNPMAIPYLHKWQQLIGQVSNYDSELIVKHLQTTMRNRVY